MARNVTQSRPRETFTVHQVADRFNVSARTVWGWIARGRLQALRLGPRTTRVTERAVQDFLRACEGAR